MSRIKPRMLILAALLSSLGAVMAPAQDLKTLVRDIFPIPSSTGNEHVLAARIEQSLPPGIPVEKDPMGSFYFGLGKGEPRLAILAALDEYGYVVSGITGDGYLRLDRVVQPPHAQFDSYLLGHPVMISTAGGTLQGIISQPAMHLLTRERREELARNFSLDLVYLDIGTRSEEEVRAKGVEILDAVTFRPDLSELANERWAGYGLGLKTGCAVLLSLAAEARTLRLPQEIIMGWMAQTKFPARGTRTALGAMRAKRALQPQEAIILETTPADRGEKSPGLGKGPVLIQAKEVPSKLKDRIEAEARKKNIPLQYLTGIDSSLVTPFLGDSSDVVALALPVKFLHTPVEVVDFADVQALKNLLLGVCGRGRAK